MAVSGWFSTQSLTISNLILMFLLVLEGINGGNLCEAPLNIKEQNKAAYLEMGIEKVFKNIFNDKFYYLYQCLKGLYMVGQPERHCDVKTGKWKSEEPRCIKENKCPVLMEYNKTALNRKAIDLIFENSFNDHTFYYYRCLKRFYMEGKQERHCDLKTGKWKSEEPRCIRGKDCTPFLPIKHGKSSCPETETGSDCTYSCNDGYKIYGEKRRTCDARSGFSSIIPSCVIIACKTFGEFLNGDRKCKSHPSEPANHGYQSCNFSCHSSYKLIGAKNVTCNQNEEWNKPLPSCHPIRRCKPLPAANNTKIICSDHPTTMLTQCRFTCDPGYKLNISDQIVKCTINGVWASAIPKCKLSKIKKN